MVTIPLPGAPLLLRRRSRSLSPLGLSLRCQVTASAAPPPTAGNSRPTCARRPAPPPPPAHPGPPRPPVPATRPLPPRERPLRAPPPHRPRLRRRPARPAPADLSHLPRPAPAAAGSPLGAVGLRGERGRYPWGRGRDGASRCPRPRGAAVGPEPP